MSVARPQDRSCRETGFTVLELLIVLALIGVIAAVGISASFYAFDISRVGRTVGNMNGVASALVRYQSDTSSLPAGGLQPVSNIASLLSPVSGNIPTRDGWGNNLYYELITSGGSTTFRVHSYGKDGTPDGAITGIWHDPFTDVVLEGENFIQTKW